MRKNSVKVLLMGGQACILYGAAEFSRDIDLVILIDDENLAALQNALKELQAEPIAVPPFSRENLERGHSCHFRALDPQCYGLRIDVMAKMRGVAAFDELYARRTTVTTKDGSLEIDLLSLPDLVRAKKTQRDKDWPMIRRLVEVDYFTSQSSNSDQRDQQLAFWFAELRTAGLLIELSSKNPEIARQHARARPAVRAALDSSNEDVVKELALEESVERDLDRVYWEGLKRELEEFRRTIRKN